MKKNTILVGVISVLSGIGGAVLREMSKERVAELKEVRGESNAALRAMFIYETHMGAISSDLSYLADKSDAHEVSRIYVAHTKALKSDFDSLKTHFHNDISEIAVSNCDRYLSKIYDDLYKYKRDTLTPDGVEIAQIYDQHLRQLSIELKRNLDSYH